MVEISQECCIDNLINSNISEIKNFGSYLFEAIPTQIHKQETHGPHHSPEKQVYQ